MDICIQYTKKSCKTGRALFEALKQKTSHVVRRAFKTLPLPSTDVLIRWGSSYQGSFPRELNSAEAVANASSKGRMMRLLKANPAIQTPNVTMLCDRESYMGQPTDMVYARDRNTMNVVYGMFSDVSRNAVYISKPITNRKHEYRVQVFNGKVVGIYEKIPHQPNTRLFKSWNCHFRKLDMSICTCKEKGQAMALEAVKTMGLLYGGVDVVKTEDNKYYVVEVNSSPGLNSINVDKWADMFLEYIRNPTPIVSVPPVVEVRRTSSLPTIE